MYIDTHAHLNHPDLINDIDKVLDRAREADIEYIIVPATSYHSSLDVIELVQKYDMLYGAVGIHPTELADFHEKQLHEVDILSTSEKIAAIGEIGLDYYWKPYDKNLQQYVLKSQLQIAKNRNLPVIIHNRESSEDLMRVIEEACAAEDDSKLRGQFHSFSGNEEMARKCIQLGFCISFTGNITYKPNEKSLTFYEIVRKTPLESLLLETDSPYLPPVPHRGKKNEPAYMKHTAERIAELKNITADEISSSTARNAKDLFRLR
jgi:TatD DNase family protein